MTASNPIKMMVYMADVKGSVKSEERKEFSNKKKDEEKQIN